MPLVLCQQDAYLRTLSTRVLRSVEGSDGYQATLEQTILYPEGGGQPADHGWIGEARVLDVRKDEDGLPVHRVDAPVEGMVEVRVDWPRRWDHMQQHTAQHLITALAKDRWGLSTVGFHLGAELCWVDLDTAEVPEATVRALEEATNEEIRAARAVRWRLVEPEEMPRLPVRSRGLPDGHHGPVRLVEIEGIDLNTCGGTHVASTAELQLVELVGVEPARGGSRLLYLAGDRARRAARERRNREEGLKARLTVGAEDLEDSVGRLQDEAGALRREKKKLAGELAGLLGIELARRAETVTYLPRPGADMAFLLAVARAVEDNTDEGRAGERFLLLTAPEPENPREGLFLLAGPPQRVRELGKELAEQLGARPGGGPPGRYQGKATRLDRAPEVAAWLAERITPS